MSYMPNNIAMISGSSLLTFVNSDPNPSVNVVAGADFIIEVML